MSHRLIINVGTPQAWEIQLRAGVNRIGRGADNDFVINHQSISTHHCEITLSGETVTLKDLGSTNGTFVERVPVTEFRLANGQNLQFGAIAAKFEAIGLPPLPDAVNLPGDGARIVVANPGPAIPQPPPPPPPVPTSGLRINRPATPHVSSAPAAATVSTPPPAPLVRQPRTHEEFEEERAATDRKMFVRGLFGAIGGGLVGMAGWYLLIRWTHMEIGYAALMVGAVTGAGARMLARQGSSLQGIICAVVALCAIVGGQYFALVSIVDKELDWLVAKDYKKELKWAKSALEATNSTDIAYFLSVRDEVSQTSVSEEDVKQFTRVDLPRYRDLINGKPTKEEYITQQKALLPPIPLTESIGVFTVIWSLFGIVAAWRIGSGNAG